MFEQDDLVSIRDAIQAYGHTPPSLESIRRVLIAAVELEVLAPEGDRNP